MALGNLIPDPNQDKALVGSLNPAFAGLKPAGPEPGDMSSLGGLPSLPSTGGMGMLKPIVTSPRQQQEQQLQQKISSFENPAAPKQGFWQNLGRTMAKVGNIAGDIVAPGPMSLVPGTDLYKRDRYEENKGELGDLQKQDLAEQKQASESNYQNAEAAHTNAETPEVGPNAESTRSYQKAETDKINNELTQGPSLATAYAHRVNELIAQGVDPSTDAVVQHLSDAITGLQKQPASKGREHVNLTGPKGVYGGTFDPNSGKYYDAQGNEIANPIPYERPITVNTGDAALDRETARFAKPYEKGISDANTQLDKIADARAMINGSAESQALGVPKTLTALVSGAGSGVRITQPELNAIATARGVKGNFEGFINSVSGQGKLTATQQQQLTKILDDVKQRILLKQQIHSNALDAINSGASREQVIQSDKTARQQLNELERYGFYTGQHVPQGTVVGFGSDGKVRIDDGR